MSDSERHDARFVTKRDWWIKAILWGGILMMLCGVIPAAMSTDRIAEIAFLALIAILSSTFMIWILYGTHYTFRGDKLVIRSGPFRWTINIHEITSIIPTRNPLSSPACSLDRLMLKLNESKFGMMISPLEKEQFLDELVLRNPALVVENGRVFRSTSTEGSTQ